MALVALAKAGRWKWVLTERGPEEHRVQSLELQLLPVAAVGHLEHRAHHGDIVHCQPAQQGTTAS